MATRTNVPAIPPHSQTVDPIRTETPIPPSLTNLVRSGTSDSHLPREQFRLRVYPETRSKPYRRDSTGFGVNSPTKSLYVKNLDVGTFFGRANLPVSLFSKTPASRPFFRSIIANIIMRLTRRFALPISGSPSQFRVRAPFFVFVLKSLRISGFLSGKTTICYKSRCRFFLFGRANLPVSLFS